MAKQFNMLSQLKVKAIKESGSYHDGGGLYLCVTATGAKSWRLYYTLNGKSREMGLGSFNAVSLAEARLKMADSKKLLAEKIDPIAARREEHAKNRLAAAGQMTFKACADLYVEAHKSGWKNKKHIQQWTSTIKTYVEPIMGKTLVKDVNVDSIMKVLEPIWQTKTETAFRVRGRIEKILDWATTRELRQGENPARWRGRLENLLPKPSKIQKVVHHPALPYSKLGDFLIAVRKQVGLDARALEFTILTASRTSEALSAQWQEIDLERGIWTIPAERMKAGKEHRVPLADAAKAILKDMAKTTCDKVWVFPGRKKDRPLSGMAMLMLLRRMKRNEITVHGFRSTFRDWAAEQTAFPREVAEGALAHSIGSKVEAAYRRSDLFEKRRQLMDKWANYCALPSIREETMGQVLKLARG